MERDHVLTERDFSVPASRETVRARLVTYLEEAGYRRISDEPLRFERGSRRGTPFAFTPKNWHSVVALALEGSAELTAVKAAFDVDKTGQMVTAREALFWEKEIEGLESAGKGAASAPGKTDEASARIGAENLRLIKILLGCIVASGAVMIGLMFIVPRSLYPFARIGLPLRGLWLAFRLFAIARERLDAKALVEDGSIPPPPVHPS